MSQTESSLLVVDDNEMNRDMLSRRLRRKGFAVDVAEDGARALAMIEQQSFDVILLDVMMPGISGLEVLREIRKQHSTTDLPVIMATAKDLSEDIVEALKLGASDYVTKPLDFPVVLARVRTQVALKSSIDEIVRLERSLEEQNKRLESVNQRMKADLDAAAKIQQALLPTVLPDASTVRFAWSFKPCDELAGDTLNILPLDDEHIGLYVLDVSGHGVPAALLSVTLTRVLSQLSGRSSLLRPECAEAPGYRLRSPARVAKKLNEWFPWSEETGQFFSLVYGLLNTRTLLFRFVSAGHPGPVYAQRDGETEMLEAPGMAIGIREDAEFQEHQLQLKPGDRLYLYSDGIPEAANPDYDLFEDERLIQSVVDGRDRSLEDSLTLLLEQVDTWCGDRPLADDISLLALETLVPDASP